MTEQKITELLNRLTAENRRKLFPDLPEKDIVDMLRTDERKLLNILKEQMIRMGYVNEDRKLWFDNPICGLSQEGMAHLKELETPNPARNEDRKRIRYLKALKNMYFTVPEMYHREINIKSFYQHMIEFCRDNDIPEEIIHRVAPALSAYIETGRLRPILFVGEKGCGKTTAVKLIVEEALRIPTAVIKIPQISGKSHGMTGTCGSYASADVGCIAKARFSKESLLVAYLFDEVDKASYDNHRVNVYDELLSITDESCNEIYDNFLETTIVGLEHCPMFMTANDINNISEPLLDRCTIIHFPNADEHRIKSISRKYVEQMLTSNIYSTINFDYHLMDKHIDFLIKTGVTSIRKYQQMIDEVLGEALNVVLLQESDDIVSVTEEMFAAAEQSIIGVTKRQMGFSY